MKGVGTITLFCIATLGSGFTPVSHQLGQTIRRDSKLRLPTITSSSYDNSLTRDKFLIAKATTNGSNEPPSTTDATGFLSGIKINPPYALAYILFLSFAYIRNAAEPAGTSMELIQQYIADPLNPGWNELFITVFNLLGLYAAPIACLLMPGAKNQKLPATPFVLGSMFGGYGALGIYASTRTPNPSPVSKGDLGWFTANVLENKIFNYLIVLMFTSAYITSGALGAFIADPGELIKGYGEMFSQSALVSASSVDFIILSLSAASFIPEDLSRRGYEGKLSPETIAASTLLVPGLGAALYCALRPELEEE